MTRPSPALAGALLACALTLSGCATVAEPGDPRRSDPFEGWNRKVFGFNEKLDENVLRPVATTYRDVVPQFVRTGVGNVFDNISDAWSALNGFLQGKVSVGMTNTMRVAINTVFGLGGLYDQATEMGLERQDEDFGQTLGTWGLGAGPYIVWPVLGPSSMRDSAALPLDLAASPSYFVSDTSSKVAISVLDLVQTRSELLGATRLLDDIALDKYTFVRDAYLSRRHSLVYDGEPPESGGDEDYDEDGGGAGTGGEPPQAPEGQSAPAPQAK
jgi:phospholipid-binding lipoprotein MlaA